MQSAELERSMRIERKRSGRTAPVKIAEGECVDRAFDGYHLVLHLIDSEGRDVRVILERHEAHRAAQFVLDELEAQRTRIDQLQAIAEKVLR